MADGHPTTRRRPDRGSSLRVREAVSDAVGREQVVRRSWAWLDLSPDVLDVRIDRSLIRFEGDAADRAQQLRAGEDPSGLARHGCEQLEFGAGEIDGAG